MNTPVTNFEALVGQARDCGLTQTFATAYEVNKALDEADCCGGSGGKIVIGDDIKLGYSSFKEVPDYFDFSQTTDFGHMFQSCANLSTISQLDTSKGTDFGNMFYDCNNLTTIPLFDTTNGTHFGNMFYDCNNLTTIPPFDTSNGNQFYNMFYYCIRLNTIPQLDTSKGTNLNNMFFYCSSLENITFTGSINKDISFNNCTSLTYESVKSILTACSNTINTDAKTLKFNRTLTDQNSELTDLVATCTSKGWTISGLTLN